MRRLTSRRHLPASLPLFSALCLLAPATIPRPLAAQLPSEVPRRPRLDAAADTNDWEAYYDHAVQLLNRRQSADARAAFYWAARLDPRRGDALYGWWVTFWMKDIGRWERYLDDDERVLDAPDVVSADSVRTRALLRNPFVHQGLVVVLFDMLPGQWRHDRLTRAWLAYARPDFPQAIRLFADVIKDDPKRYGNLRYVRAAAFVSMRQDDSALAELNTLLAEQRAQEQKRLVTGADSKEFLHYAIGGLHVVRGDIPAGTAALQQALVENAAFFPAHAWLGEIALARHDTATALREYAQAVELAPGDAVLHAGYGAALLAASRPREASDQYREAIRLEPYYADSYFNLGLALDAAGDQAGAVAAYRDYTARAPRRDTARLERTRQRLAALATTTTP
jgi:Tfp pilus assembly protein PilF